MRELINKVIVTGTLVKNDIDEFQDKQGNDAIGGSLILRTADDSEHEIRFFAYKYKRDENKNFTPEESYFYQKYLEAKDNLKDSEHCSEGESPDVISITDGMFIDNDFKAKDGSVVSSNHISARFINKIKPKDYESTVLEAKFEVEGIVDKIEDEIKKGIPTGNLTVVMNAIGQTSDGFGKDAVYTADKLIPIKMTVDKSMATAFRQAGYYEGAYTKLVGTIINSVDVITEVEKAAFGNDIKKEIKTPIRKNEIKSGTAVSTIFEHELTQEIVDTLKTKRKAKLAEIKAGVAKTSKSKEGFGTGASIPAPQTTYNPFAQN